MILILRATGVLVQKAARQRTHRAVPSLFRLRVVWRSRTRRQAPWATTLMILRVTERLVQTAPARQQTCRSAPSWFQRVVWSRKTRRQAPWVTTLLILTQRATGRLVQKAVRQLTRRAVPSWFRRVAWSRRQEPWATTLLILRVMERLVRKAAWSLFRLGFLWRAGTTAASPAHGGLRAALCSDYSGAGLPMVFPLPSQPRSTRAT
mmetsp:Transcript_31014/g.47914  ORF Transcript_31014/g.47914 Transcript_31014/m.47914 type:complete len:206 (+) Transcript_31014:501-1118(+)